MQEKVTRGKTSTSILLGVGLVVLAAAGIALYPGFVESRLIQTVTSGRADEAERSAAARQLADLGSLRAIPALIRVAAGLLDADDDGSGDPRIDITNYQAQITSLLKARERLVQARETALAAENAQGGLETVGLGRQSTFMLNQIQTIDSRLAGLLESVDSVFAGDVFFDSLRSIVSSAGREALPYLLPELHRERDWPRAFIAIRLLDETGAEAVRALERLELTLKSEHPLLRYAARRALDGIHESSVEAEDPVR